MYKNIHIIQELFLFVWMSPEIKNPINCSDNSPKLRGFLGGNPTIGKLNLIHFDKNKFQVLKVLPIILIVVVVLNTYKIIEYNNKIKVK